MRAAATPPFGCRIRRMRGSTAAISRTTGAVSSFDPSSTTMTSKSLKVWSHRDASVRPTNPAALYAGTITLTYGAAMAHLAVCKTP